MIVKLNKLSVRQQNCLQRFQPKLNKPTLVENRINLTEKRKVKNKNCNSVHNYTPQPLAENKVKMDIPQKFIRSLSITLLSESFLR